MATSAEQPSADALVGHVLADRYRIEAQLGEGGMGTVYRAHHLGLDCPVAVKMLHPELTADREVAQRFDREAIALSKLDHPNCLRVLDAGTSPAGAKYIVMPLLAGQELRALIDGPLALPRAVDLAVQILRGLEHAHRRGLIHRDLKPENVFVGHDDDGREVAKLVDFGIVKMLAQGTGVKTLTRAGLVFGTPRYMSPEQVTGGKIDERTDLYAVGVLLYEMIAGIPPFDAEDVGMLMRMQILADVPALPETVPPAVVEVVGKLLEKSPNDRPKSAKEVRESLELALRTAPGRTVIAASGTDPTGATIAANAAIAAAAMPTPRAPSLPQPPAPPPPATSMRVAAVPPPPSAIGTEPTMAAPVAAPPPPSAIGTEPTMAAPAAGVPLPAFATGPTMAAPVPGPVPRFGTDPTQAAAPVSVSMPVAAAPTTAANDRRRWPIVAAIASALFCILLLAVFWPEDPPPATTTAPPAAMTVPLPVGMPGPSAAGPTPADTPPADAADQKDRATQPSSSGSRSRPRSGSQDRDDDDDGRSEGKGRGKGHKKKKGKMKFEGGGFSFDIH